MPNHDATIGALTGNKAAPYLPRDFTVIWRDRLIFERPYPADDPRPTKRTEDILKLLLSLKKPAKLDRRQNGRTATTDAAKEHASPGFPGQSLTTSLAVNGVRPDCVGTHQTIQPGHTEGRV